MANDGLRSTTFTMGHPIGCSGARIMVTLLNALAERKGKLGLASLCHGTGGATVVAVERI